MPGDITQDGKTYNVVGSSIGEHQTCHLGTPVLACKTCTVAEVGQYWHGLANCAAAQAVHATTLMLGSACKNTRALQHSSTHARSSIAAHTFSTTAQSVHRRFECRVIAALSSPTDDNQMLMLLCACALRPICRPLVAQPELVRPLKQQALCQPELAAGPGPLLQDVGVAR
jgi:hypothetical protein